MVLQAKCKMEELKADFLKCQNCGLCNANHVFGAGNPTAPILIIGEAPGEEEDEQGVPFVGASGKFLDKYLENAGIDKNCDVYMTNVVKCRPTEMKDKDSLKNREPNKQERKACRIWLDEQIRIMDPKVIICLGKIAQETVSENCKEIENDPLDMSRDIKSFMDAINHDLDEPIAKLMAFEHHEFLLINLIHPSPLTNSKKEKVMHYSHVFDTLKKLTSRAYLTDLISLKK